MTVRACAGWIFTWLLWAQPIGATDAGLKLLFLGDNGHHQPPLRFRQLQPIFQDHGIDLTYSDDPSCLALQTLDRFDGLLLYANMDQIDPPAAEALLQYVESGHGFIPLHCATYCFRNDPRIVALMGAQFLRHGAEVFATVIAEPEHPVMRGFQGFQSWDETYIHHLHHEQDRVVLEYRQQGPQAEGQRREPWTWVRRQGRGRVFYTAWGHDARTWGHPGFLNLVERGVRWACGQDPSAVAPYLDPQRWDDTMTAPRTDVKPFEYVDVGTKSRTIPLGNSGARRKNLFPRCNCPCRPKSRVDIS